MAFRLLFSESLGPVLFVAFWRLAASTFSVIVFLIFIAVILFVASSARATVCQQSGTINAAVLNEPQPLTKLLEPACASQNRLGLRWYSLHGRKCRHCVYVGHSYPKGSKEQSTEIMFQYHFVVNRRNALLAKSGQANASASASVPPECQRTRFVIDTILHPACQLAAEGICCLCSCGGHNRPK